MKTSGFSFFCLICALFFVSDKIAAQNLFANPDFEDENTCPEFQAHCAPEAWKEANYNGLQYINSSKGGKVGIVVGGEPVQRTYLFTELLCPLVAGEWYDISFDLNLRGAAFRPFGICFSTDDRSGHFDPARAHPVLTLNKDHCAGKIKKMDWMSFQGAFKATGGERFFYLGYFEQKGESGGKSGPAQLFYFDNISLTPRNKKIVLCAEADQRRAALYADDWRHIPPGLDTMPVLSTLPETLLASNARTGMPDVRILVAPRSDTLFLSGVCFDFNKSSLNAHYAGVADSLAAAVAMREPEKVLIIGYTDDIGSDAFNQELSLARAHTVQRILVEKGVAESKIFCEGRGKAMPVAANNTEAGRALNRRIEIVLFF